jgi:glycosyltransferase involved in cell wall biosynthesis
MRAPRHVLLNALYLAPGESGGTETYLRGLTPALAREFPDLRITLATTGSGAAALRADGWESFVRIHALPCEEGRRVRRLRAEQVLLPRLAHAERADLVHSLANIVPLFPRTRSVVTLHDVTFLETPTFGRLTTLGMGFFARQAARRADALITVSTAAREQICEVLGADPARLTVVHNGYEPTRVARATPPVELRARYELQDARVVLCVAAKRPHKNQELLIRAATQLDGDTAIVLAGHAESYEQRLRALVRELGLEDRVRFVGYAPDADLEGLWSMASCAAFPTLGEGFGLPVIEALAHGVSVAASDIPVLHEVGGSLPHWFDPHDPASCARAIRAALADGERTRRDGPAHAARFSWSAAAHATHAVYERALVEPPR